MKILFILDLYKPHIGWVETLFENIISWLIKKWNDVVLLTSKFDKSLEKYEKITDKLEIYRVWHNRYDFMFYSIFLWIKLAKKCDIIHTTTYNSAIPASIIWILSWKKVVLTVHEIFWMLWYKFMWFKWFFFKLFERVIFLFPFSKYICVSNYTKNNLRVHLWIPDSKLKTIYNWIDYNFWNRENFKKEEYLKIKKDLGFENNFVWLFFGRAWVSKWVQFYVKAIPEIIKSIPDFKALLIIPDSPNNPNSWVKKLIKDFWIQNNVFLIPWIKNTELPNYILLSDFVLIPSLVEWFGFAVAEVSALKQNLITTNASAIPEVASGNVSYVEPGNVSDIVKKVIDLKNGKIGFIEEKRFSWDDCIENTLEVYREVLDK